MNTATVTPARFTVAGYNDTVATHPAIGQLVWFSVNDVHVKQTVLAAELAAHGLGHYAPNMRAASDVFRTVTKDLQRTITHDDGTKSKVMIRDVTANRDQVVRRLVVEHVDGAGQRLSYRQTWELLFEKLVGTVKVRPIQELGGDVFTRNRYIDPDLTDDFAPLVLDEFRRLSDSINADGVRSLIKRTLDGSHAVSVRPTGGVFFVPQAHVANVEALIKATRFIDGTQVIALTITAQDAGTNDMLASAVTDETLTDADDMIAEFGDALFAGKPVSKRRLNTMHEKFEHLRDRLTAYKDLVRDDLSTADAALLLLESQLLEAMRRAA